jgi:hypothetical protein
MSHSISALGVSIRAAKQSSGSVTTVAARRETAGASVGSGPTAARGAAEWLGLAAAPTFAIMALLTGVLGGGPSDLLCAAANGASPLGGMVPMYVLMSAFHAAPWLRLVSGRRSGARRS